MSLSYSSTVKLHFEKIDTGGQSLTVFERDDPRFAFHWHYHPEYELTLIVDSSGQRLVGDGIADYGPGDLVLLGPGLPHSWRSTPARHARSKRHRAVVVQFPHHFVGSEFLALEEMKPVADLLRRARAGLAFGTTLVAQQVAARLQQLPTFSPPQRLLQLLLVLEELSGAKNAAVLSTARVRPGYRAQDQQRITAICSYLDKHHHGSIDFAALSRSVALDQASLCRFFKRATGRTMTTYVNELRVGEAAQLLAGTSLSTLEIGLRVGFRNYANFSRQFRRLKGHAPSELRHKEK